MEKDPHIVARRARACEDENWRFRSFLNLVRHISDARLNRLAAGLAREAEAQMDCTACGACCRANHVPVDDGEIERLAGAVSLPVLAFRENYLDRDDDDQLALDANPCPFLVASRCSVYESRPRACRDYPYIGGDVRGGIVGILERAGTCPIIFEMMEQLKHALGFHRYE